MRFETPNGVMHTLAAPSTGTTELSVWRVEMPAGTSGPAHRADGEQIWVLLTGALEADVSGEMFDVSAGAALTIPAGESRRIRTSDGFEAVVSSPAAPTVTTEDGESRPLPWGA